MGASAYANNVVIDLEFTPTPVDNRPDGLADEIVEIGAVKLDSSYAVVGTFSKLVRPTLSSGIASRIYRLTGIRNEEVAQARTLSMVLAEFAEWIGGERTRIIAWGPADRMQVERECRAKGIDVDLPQRWIDIQRLYPRLMHIRPRPVALSEAANWCGIAPDTKSVHRALYDAEITAELFQMMAAGDLRQQHEALQHVLHADKPKETPSATIADRVSGLGELLAQLKAQEQGAG